MQPLVSGHPGYYQHGDLTHCQFIDNAYEFTFLVYYFVTLDSQ